MKQFILVLFILSVSTHFMFSSGKKEDESSIKIGISKIIEHPALNAIEKGIIDELSESEFKNISYNLQNASGDMSAASHIAELFKFDRMDLVIGIATPTAIALANGIKDIPVIFSAVTDPISAGLVDDLLVGKNNITGVSDMTPVEEQIELISKLLNVKKIGHIYSAGEPNAVKIESLAKLAAKKLSIEFISTSVTNSSEISQAALLISRQVDAIYLSTDNMVISALDSIVARALEYNIPVITADPTSAKESSVLGAYGFNNYKLGRLTGKTVLRVLRGESPSSIETQFLTDPSDLELVLNLQVARQLGISLNNELVDKADVLIGNRESQ